jgi:hypothetical protein
VRDQSTYQGLLLPQGGFKSLGDSRAICQKCYEVSRGAIASSPEEVFSKCMKQIDDHCSYSFNKITLLIEVQNE